MTGPEAPSIPQLVAAHARAHPHRVAVVSGTEQVTYADLVGRVRGLAATLREQYGVGPDVPVPLLLERGPSMSVAILAVMSAGGICVPMDPSHPAARLRFMLEDCGARLVVTNVDTDASFVGDRRVLDLRRTETAAAAGPPPTTDADDLRAVYCLYTSGSTGQPKGVLLTQRGIRNVLEWARDHWGVRPSDGVLHKTTFTFDISIVEQFLPLTAGARLIVLPVGAERSPAAIREAMVEHDATIVQFTPSGLAAYLAATGDDPLPGIRCCLSAGEPLKPALRDAFFGAVEGCRLHNLYGPTETTIYATAADVPPRGAITAGVPLPGTTLRIVDEQGRPAADGEVGEIWIAGAGVARGYLNQPAFTAQRFIGDASSPDARAYRTGDLGVVLPSGEIDVRGRSDHQVKIRGYRVELGEVESALAALDGVLDAAVVSVDSGDQHDLVAYWIGDGDARSLADGLRRTLPGYMVPSRFVRMESFPLTSSGKVHRAELLPPDLDSRSSGPYVPPADALGAAACAVFEEVLGGGPVGLHDRFLDLGGDSLRAVRVGLLLQQRLERTVDIEALLRNETIGALVEQLKETSSGGPGSLRPAPAAEWHPLAAGQRGLWLLDQIGAAHAAYTEPLVFGLDGPLDTDALGRAVRSVVSRHESLRTAIEQVDGVALQRVRPVAELDWRHEVITDAAAVERRLSAFVALDFDLARGRLLRGLLIERSAEEHVFALALHHVATDGWSLTVLVDELSTAYNACLAGEEPPPVPAIQFKDYAHWQQQRLDDGHLAEARDYWTRTLAGVETLDQPTDRPHPTTRSYRGRTIRSTLPPDSLAALRALGRAEHCTLYAVLCAVSRVLFHRYAGQRDFALGTSALGRPVPELEGQLGYYVNSMALRGEIAPGMTFRGVLQATHTTLLEAMRHAEYPFELVVADLGASTTADRHPLFDVMVMLDPGWGDPGVAMDGVRMQRRDPPNTHSKMDLTLFFKETDAGLLVTAEYSTDVFDADRIERLIEHIDTLGRAAAADPGAEVGALALLPGHERDRVLVGFNDTDTDYRLDTPVHELFERQARRVPERTATVDEQGSLSFAELDARADSLAWVLRDDHDVRPGGIVALLMDRGVHTVVAILAVLKAGGAYLPMNPNDPPDRIEAVLRDSGGRVLLTDDVSAAAIVAGECAVLDVSAVRPPRPEAPPPLAGPDDPAYCIYTSGSTGVPNGVLIEHRSLVNRLCWMVDDLDLDDSDVFLQKTPYTFDVSVWELLLPGMLGARQVMLRPSGEGDPAAIREAIERHGVTTLHFVPSMLEQYLAGVSDGFRPVRHCVCSGEALGDELAARFFRATDGTRTRLHNYYGPTEATVDVSLLEVERGRPVTIGRPAANTRLYVLDAADRPSPIGVTGELCISGVQVPAATATDPS